MASKLEETCQDLEAAINLTVEFIREEPSIRELGDKCNAISRDYRALGICELLLEADVDAFNHQLIRSAQTRTYYLRRCHEEKHLVDPAMRASIVGPFLDALAAHQLSVAREIAALSPVTWWRNEEYEEDFLYAHFLYRLMAEGEPDAQALQKVLDALKAEVQGMPSERLELCRALLAMDQELFDRAFAELLEGQLRFLRAEKKTARAEELSFLPESRIFVEGLALLELAELRGLKAQAEYPPLCPSLARMPAEKVFDAGYFPGMPLGGR